MIQAVLFDLGNVVWRIHLDKTFSAWAEGSNQTAEAVAKLFAIDEAYKRHEVGTLGGEEYHHHISRLLKFDLPFEQFSDGWQAMLGEPIPETIDLIADLKSRYKIYGLSNSNLLHRKVWSTKYEVLKSFNRVFCSSEIGFRKPDPRAFEKVCDQTGVPKENFLFVDDLKENIEAAQEFGMKVVHFTTSEISIRKIRNELGL